MLIETNCFKYKSFLVTVTNEELSLKLLSCMYKVIQIQIDRKKIDKKGTN